MRKTEAFERRFGIYKGEGYACRYKHIIKELLSEIDFEIEDVCGNRFTRKLNNRNTFESEVLDFIFDIVNNSEEDYTPETLRTVLIDNKNDFKYYKIGNRLYKDFEPAEVGKDLVRRQRDNIVLDILTGEEILRLKYNTIEVCIDIIENFEDVYNKAVMIGEIEVLDYEGALNLILNKYKLSEAEEEEIVKIKWCYPSFNPCNHSIRECDSTSRFKDAIEYLNNNRRKEINIKDFIWRVGRCGMEPEEAYNTCKKELEDYNINLETDNSNDIFKKVYIAWLKR